MVIPISPTENASDIFDHSRLISRIMARFLSILRVIGMFYGSHQYMNNSNIRCNRALTVVLGGYLRFLPCVIGVSYKRRHVMIQWRFYNTEMKI